LKLHLAIYEEDEDYNAVVHSHGPYATAFSIAPMEIPPLTDETQILVPNLKNSLVSYAPRGSAELASAVSPLFRIMACLQQLLLSSMPSFSLGPSRRIFAFIA
jgi:ribulose-5-phosphate 4-epimerase/fuculose-1-phosphate aldolase